jgi:hypothetical protein
MRLIDADALRTAMYHEAFEKDSDMQKWDSGCWIRYKMFENVLENMPTVTSETENKGYWIKLERKRLTYRCSQCRDISGIPTKFCNNCGADMRERRLKYGDQETAQETLSPAT